MGNGTAFRAANGLARLLAIVFVAAVAAAPAHADLHGAYNDYKKGDLTQAFQEFLALAELGQPQAQFILADMYHAGQGTEQSDIHAYAWATLAAANGETSGKALADTIRPILAPRGPPHAADPSQSKPIPSFKLKLDKAYLAPDPTDARRGGVQGWVFVELTVMLDGRPRFPRVIYADPSGVFDDTVKESVLRTRFLPAPQGATPVRAVIPFHFSLTSPEGSYGQLAGVPARLVADAKAGGPEADLLYGLLLEPGVKSAGGIPWLLKAAQAGLGTAQYEIGSDLLAGNGCRADEAKGLRWLRMAADQGQPNAELILAAQLLHGTPSAADVARAKALLERTSGGDTKEESSQDAQLLLAAILAATLQPALRDPQRALKLLSKFDDSDGDPTPLEIRAAAQAAEGDFARAMESEKQAIRRAHFLQWDLSPLQARLVAYQAGKAWYGSLLDF